MSWGGGGLGTRKEGLVAEGARSMEEQQQVVKRGRGEQIAERGGAGS